MFPEIMAQVRQDNYREWFKLELLSLCTAAQRESCNQDEGLAN